MQRLVWGVGLTVLTLWLVWASLHPILRGLGFGQPIEKLGQWGDSFGALNALFAAFGFSAVVVTLWLQRRQIQDAQDEQHRQRFESSYFELLKLLREVRNDLRFTYSDEFVTANPNRSKGVRRGSNAFIAAWREARFYIRRAGRELTKALTAKSAHQLRTRDRRIEWAIARLERLWRSANGVSYAQVPTRGHATANSREVLSRAGFQAARLNLRSV